METMKKLKKVYEALADEQSRDIFKYRLLYSVTGSKIHIRAMVDEEIHRYGKDDAMFCLMEWIMAQNRQIIVFGAGFAGRQIVETLADFGIDVAYIADNDESLWGKVRYGRMVLTPGKLALMKETSIVIGINDEAENVYRQIREMGIPKNRIYISPKSWWLGKDWQYFDVILPHSVEKETFVDAGAFDETDSKHFISWCKNAYEKIYAFEPDHDNCGRAKETFLNNENVAVFEKGIWHETETLRFQSGIEENCTIKENGNVEVKVTALDEEISDASVTFIIMDVEGSKLQALDGAKRLISQNCPKLAICVYHRPEDIIEIPLKILSFISDYKLYLRHYSYADKETVLYAIKGASHEKITEKTNCGFDRNDTSCP